MSNQIQKVGEFVNEKFSVDKGQKTVMNNKGVVTLIIGIICLVLGVVLPILGIIGALTTIIGILLIYVRIRSEKVIIKQHAHAKKMAELMAKQVQSPDADVNEQT